MAQVKQGNHIISSLLRHSFPSKIKFPSEQGNKIQAEIDKHIKKSGKIIHISDMILPEVVKLLIAVDATDTNFAVGVMKALPNDQAAKSFSLTEKVQDIKREVHEEYRKALESANNIMDDIVEKTISGEIYVDVNEIEKAKSAGKLSAAASYDNMVSGNYEHSDLPQFVTQKLTEHLEMLWESTKEEDSQKNVLLAYTLDIRAFDKMWNSKKGYKVYYFCLILKMLQCINAG